MNIQNKKQLKTPKTTKISNVTELHTWLSHIGGCKVLPNCGDQLRSETSQLSCHWRHIQVAEAPKESLPAYQIHTRIHFLALALHQQDHLRSKIWIMFLKLQRALGITISTAKGCFLDHESLEGLIKKRKGKWSGIKEVNLASSLHNLQYMIFYIPFPPYIPLWTHDPNKAQVFDLRWANTFPNIQQ